WPKAFETIAPRVRQTSPERLGVIAGDLQDAESMKAAMDLFRALGVPSLDCRQDGAELGGGARASYLFNTTILGLESCDALLLIGTNPRREAALLNARIRKTWLLDRMRVGVIGEQADLKYDYAYLGAGPGSIGRIGEGDFAQVLRDAKNPAV